MSKYEIKRGFRKSKDWPKWLKDEAGLEAAHDGFEKVEAIFKKKPSTVTLASVETAMAKVLKARIGTIAACKRALLLNKEQSNERRTFLKLLQNGQAAETARMGALRAKLADSIKAVCSRARLKTITLLLDVGLASTKKLIATGSPADAKAAGTLVALQKSFANAEAITTKLTGMKSKLARACPAAVAHIKTLEKDVEKLRPLMERYEGHVAQLANAATS